MAENFFCFENEKVYNLVAINTDCSAYTIKKIIMSINCMIVPSSVKLGIPSTLYSDELSNFSTAP